jgi:hypothetical protein
MTPTTPPQISRPSITEWGKPQANWYGFYREHQMRFAWAAEVNAGFGFGPNVLVHYLDGDQEQERVYGNVVQPVDAAWLADMKARLKSPRDGLDPVSSAHLALATAVDIRRNLLWP